MMYYETAIDAITHKMYSQLERFTIECFAKYGYSEDEVYNMFGHHLIMKHSAVTKRKNGDDLYTVTFYVNDKPLFQLIQWFEMDMEKRTVKWNTEFRDLKSLLAK